MVAFLSESLGYQAYLAHHTRPENTPVSRPEAGVYRIFPGEVFCRLPVEPNGPICPYTAKASNLSTHFKAAHEWASVYRARGRLGPGQQQEVLTWYNRHFGDAESSDEDAKSHHDEAYNAAGPFEVINVAGFGGSNATTDASKIRRLNEAHRLRRANEINEINEINGGSRNIMEIGNSSDDDADAEYCDNARGNNINVDTGNSNTGMVIGASTTHNNNSNNNNNRPSNSKSNKSASNGKANGNLLSHGFTRASQSDKLRMQYLEEQVKTAVALRVKAETEAQMAEEMRAHQERMQDIELRAKQNETGMY